MGKVEKISISLTGDMLGELQQAVASGAYASTSEVVREALREWKAKRAGEQATIEELRDLIREARASGYEPYDGVESIKEEGRKRLAELRK
jgi:antitoxin ParD1/3/4